MQAGARNFLQKKSIDSELIKVLQQLIHLGAQEQSELGSVITVFSAGGGCGATTVVLNLANELRIVSSSKVLTIDLDVYYGAISSYLGIEGKYGIADVLSRNGQIDKDLIRSSAYVHKPDFHILSSPAGLNSKNSKPLKYENLIEVLQSCREVYRYTIIDAPRVSTTLAKELVSICDEALVVFQLTFKDVKFLKTFIKVLTKARIGPEKILLLANRFDKHNSVVSLDDWQQMLPVNQLHRIRNDWRTAMNCINNGQPVADTAPRSGLRKDFRKLADKINTYSTNDKR
jgi:pilus assembly protein CpaE